MISIINIQYVLNRNLPVRIYLCVILMKYRPEKVVKKSSTNGTTIKKKLFVCYIQTFFSDQSNFKAEKRTPFCSAFLKVKSGNFYKIIGKKLH